MPNDLGIMENKESYVVKDIEKIKQLVRVDAEKLGYSFVDDRFSTSTYIVKLTKPGYLDLVGEGLSLYEAYENALGLLKSRWARPHE